MATGAVMEEVAENLEEAAQVARQIDARVVGFFIGGMTVGFAIGFYFGHRFNNERIRAEAFAQSEEEVEKIRAIYQQKLLVAEPKATLEEIIEERGYSVRVEDEEIERERPLPAPVPIQEEHIHRPPYIQSAPASDEPPRGVSSAWVYAKELDARTPDAPYVIHIDEFREGAVGYERVTYTYYSQDDVLVGEDEKPLPLIDLVVGQTNLKWGHGSDDMNLVYIRNDKLNLDIEICRSPGSYEAEVLGLEHSHTSEKIRRRHDRFDDHDDST